MTALNADDLLRLVRAAFPQKQVFSVQSDLGLRADEIRVLGFVHGGADPLLDRQFDDWLAGTTPFTSAYQLLNRLCRVGALPPGSYCVKACADAVAREPQAPPTATDLTTALEAGS